MRMKSWNCLASLLLLTLLLCACGQDASDSEEDAVVEEFSEYYPAKVIGPEVEPTLETRLATAQQAYDNMCYSYSEMQELAEAENASKKGKKAAAKLEEKYADRIAKLADTDFSQLTSEDLFSISQECTDIISAIRDVKDALNTN